MRRLPIVSTLVVALAVATMIALGCWQIRRAAWKEALLASYHSAATAPALPGIPARISPDAIAFRRTHVACRITTAPTVLGGNDRQGGMGFRNIVGCALADGRVIMADLGVSALGASPALPGIGRPIAGDGVLVPDDVLAGRVIGKAPRATPLLLVLDTAIPGLKASQPPSIETIPNNHLSYAVQWFLFAGVALIIYILALWKRRRA